MPFWARHHVKIGTVFTVTSIDHRKLVDLGRQYGFSRSVQKSPQI